MTTQAKKQLGSLQGSLQSLQDVFSQRKRYTEKETIPGLQEESSEQRDPKRSL